MCAHVTSRVDILTLKMLLLFKDIDAYVLDSSMFVESEETFENAILEMIVVLKQPVGPSNLTLNVK